MMQGWRKWMAAALLSAFCWPVSAALASGSADLNVAFIGDLSGSDAYKAQDALDGFRLGIKHLGGRLATVEFDLAWFDDRHNPEVARSLMEKLQRDLRPQFTLVAADPKIEATLAPMADEGHSFQLMLNPPPLSMAGKDCHSYVFSLAGLAETQHEAAGLYMTGQGFHRVLVAMPASAAAQNALDAFRRGYKGEVLTQVSHRGEMSFAAEIKDIAAKKPDAVYLLETGGKAVNFIREYDDKGLKDEMPLFGPLTSLDQSVLAGAAPSSLNLFSVGPWSEDLDSPSNRRLMSDFEGEYGRPASSYAAVGYDAAMLLDAALRGADRKFNNDEMIRTMLRRADFASTRPGFRFDTNQMPVQTYLLRSAQKDARGHMTNEQRGVLQKDMRDGHAGECPMRWVVDTPAQPAKP